MKKVMASVFLAVLVAVGCTPTEPINNGLTLSAEVSSTEAWLKLNANNITLPKNVTITRDGNNLFNFTLTTRDTTLYDSTLAPNKSYTYQALLYPLGGQSEKVLVTTLDTTSHNFSWQTFTFGDTRVGSSTLYDVSIVNDTLAYAAGEIYLSDSTGQPDPLPYNLAKWNGKEWILKRVKVNFRGNLITLQLEGIFCFSPSQIWLVGSLPIYGDGSNWTMYDLRSTLDPNISLSKAWGTGPEDMFFVGSNGSIVHYTNDSWQKIESGTSYSLYDIYSNDGKNIYASGGSFGNYNGVLLKGNSNGFSILKEGKNVSAGQLFHPYFGGIAKTVWVGNADAIYFGGNLLYRYKSNNLDLVRTLPGNYLNGNVNGEYWGFISQIRGNGENDIIMAGEGNTIRHFNGVTWRQLGTPYNYSSDYTWLSVAMKNNLIITVGRSGRQAIIMVLKRR